MPSPDTRFHHVSLSVADLDALERWYGAAFGLDKVEERVDLPEAGVRTAVLSDGRGLRVELIERGGSRPVSHSDPLAAAGDRTFGHLALQVPDLDTAFAYLTGECEARTVSPPAPGASAGMRYAYIHDPEDNLLELIESRGA
ncbi:VOC family protein [Streptomyces sp. NPDC091292]|uniref:VOC family protein n=1 Tax=Streptomyces sp. NPDC091292 TaxID=3365991 RepID=UPI003824A146